MGWSLGGWLAWTREVLKGARWWGTNSMAHVGLQGSRHSGMLIAEELQTCLLPWD